MYRIDPFPISVPQNPSSDEFYEAQKRRSTDFKALKLYKGRSGKCLTKLNDYVELLTNKKERNVCTKGPKFNIENMKRNIPKNIVVLKK